MKKNATQEHKPGCVVCGARLAGDYTYLNACDSVCSRAHAAGRTRGKQMEAEVRAVARHRRENEPQPSLGATGVGYRTDNDYNRPYLFAQA